MRFTIGSQLLPRIEETKALYGSLAGSHLNLALRLLQQGATSPGGDVSTLCQDSLALQDVVMKGHKWWVLAEETDSQEQVELSLWRNQDQHENHASHEIEILQTIQTTAETWRTSAASSSSSRHVAINDLAARATRRIPAKVSAYHMTMLVKFWSQFIQNDRQDLLNELGDDHAANVNPRSLVMPMLFFRDHDVK